MENVGQKLKITCPSCGEDLAAPLEYEGRIRCPSCAHVFLVEAFSDQSDMEEGYKEIDPHTGFWFGLIAPASLPIIVFVLASTGIFDYSSPALLGITYFMCSLCIWPVIGFGIAYSGRTFVGSFRAGARVSGVIGLFLGSLIWLVFLSWISGGITN